MADSFWKPPPSPLALDAGRVHLWRVELDSPQSALILTPAEAARRDRFLFDRERRRFAGTRTALRLILGRYLSLDPAAVALTEEAGGKPHLLGRELEFNVSHSGELALIAVASGRRVGVDVERERRMSDSLSIAHRFFSPAELEILQRDPNRFLECWTCKEAQVKAIGGGVWNLAGVDVWRATPRRHYHLQGASWTLQQVPAGAGYVGAVVVEGEDDWEMSGFG